jgi:hypothetical protein
VASNGLIEKVRTNVVLYSQDFSQTATWVTSTTTRVDSQTDPNGGTTASKFTATGANSNVIQTLSVSSGVPYTWSFFAKSDSATDVNIRLDNNNGNFVQANMALTTSWQRFSITLNSNATTILCFLGGGLSFTSGEIAYMAFAQLEASDIATDYIATTTAAVSVGPVSGLPRLDYLNGECPSLLLEPQRTNLAQYSEQFNNAYWTKSGATITANTTTSPDGYVNADKLIGDIGAGAKYISASIATPSGVNNLATSFFVKASGVDYIVLRNNTNAGSTPNCTFNVSTGENTYNGMTGTPTIESLSDGWYRITCVNLSTTAASRFFRLYLSDVNVVSDTEPSYTGDGTSGVFIYGAQLETGAYATSYIPTLGTSVTRVADAASKTGITSLIGQTEGVIFIDFVATAQNADGAGFSIITIFGDGNENFQLYAIGTALYWYAWIGSILIDQTATQTLVAGDRYKVAYAYKSGDWALYINGVQKRTNTAATVPATSQFNLNASGFGASPVTAKNEYNQVLLFKTRLDNATLQSLTTL